MRNTAASGEGYEGGHYRDSDIGLCQKFLKRDGFTFCRSALENSAFFNCRDNAALVQWFIRTITSGLRSEHYQTDYDGAPIQDWYISKATTYFQELPKVFIDPGSVQAVADGERELTKSDRKSFWR